jgi:geranylgeranyl reductase family protein
MTDTIVVGGGPGGTAAALTLARAGTKVTLIDKAVFPRDKCCGDGLTAGALRRLEALGLDPREVPSWKPVERVQIAGPRGEAISFDLPFENGSFAVIARRAELDAALLRLAVEAGVEVREGVSLLDLSVVEDGIRAHTSEGIIQAKNYIAADGMWSPTRKLMGLNTDGYRGEWHAFRQYFDNVSESAKEELFVWFEKDLLPGYVWAFPLADGTANVGFGIQRGRGIEIQQMKDLWAELLQRPRVRDVLGDQATPIGRHMAWPIPARLGRLKLHHGRVLFVGDAAAATDPMTGEGIGQALETGQLGANAILDNPGDHLAAGAQYAAELHRSMERDHKLAQVLSDALARPGMAQASVRIAGATGWTRRNFARWLFEDYPRAVLGTPRRWHRRLFSQPGAYRASPAARTSHLATESVCDASTATEEA